MDTRHNHSLAALIVAQRAHEGSGHGGRDEGQARAQQRGLPLTKANPATAPAECPICQQERWVLSPCCSPVPQRDPYSPLPPLWKGK